MYRPYLKKRDVIQSCLTLCDPHGLYSPWNSPGQNTEGGSLSLLQGIFPTQGLNPGLQHCRWIFLPAEPQGKYRNTGVDSLSLLQQIFPTQESNLGLLHCRGILYQLSYQGSPIDLIDRTLAVDLDACPVTVMHKLFCFCQTVGLYCLDLIACVIY